MLNGPRREQGLSVSFVIARAAGLDSGRLAVADIVADHRPSPAPAARAAEALAFLPGCSVFLAPDGRGAYLAFLRGGRCVPIRSTQSHGSVSVAAAEICAAALYAWACVGQVPPTAIVLTAWL